MATGERGAVRPKITAAIRDTERRRELDVAKSWGYRLAEWRDLPDDDRDLLMAHDMLVCPSCGNLREDCSNPALEWHPRTSTCWATASLQWGQRRLAEIHKGDKPADEQLHPLDGVGVWVSRDAPELDEFV